MTDGGDASCSCRPVCGCCRNYVHFDDFIDLHGIFGITVLLPPLPHSCALCVCTCASFGPTHFQMLYIHHACRSSSTSWGTSARTSANSRSTPPPRWSSGSRACTSSTSSTQASRPGFPGRCPYHLGSTGHIMFLVSLIAFPFSFLVLYCNFSFNHNHFRWTHQLFGIMVIAR